MPLQGTQSCPEIASFSDNPYLSTCLSQLGLVDGLLLMHTGRTQAASDFRDPQIETLGPVERTSQMKTQKEELESTQQAAFKEPNNLNLSLAETQTKVPTNMGCPSNSLDLDSNQEPSNDNHLTGPAPHNEENGLGSTGFFRDPQREELGPVGRTLEMKTQKELLESSQEVALADLSNFGLSLAETQQKLLTNMGRPSNSLDLDSNKEPSDNNQLTGPAPHNEENGLGLIGFFRDPQLEVLEPVRRTLEIETQKELLESSQEVALADLSNFGLSLAETQQKLLTNMGRPSNSLDLDSIQLPSDNNHPSYQTPPEEGPGLTGFFRPKDAPPMGPTNEELCISRALASPNLILTVEELKKVQSLVAIDDDSRITLDSCRFTFFKYLTQNIIAELT